MTRYRTERVKKFRPKTTTKTRQYESTIPVSKTRQVPVTSYDRSTDVHYFNTPVDGSEQLKYGKDVKFYNEDGVPYTREEWIKENRNITTLKPHGISRDNLTARTSFKEEHYDEQETVLLDEEYEVDGLEIYYEEEQVPYTVENKVAYEVAVRKPYKIAKRVPYDVQVTRVPVTKYVDEEYTVIEKEDYEVEVTRQVPRTVIEDETYKKAKVIYVDEDYEQSYLAPKEIQVKEYYTEESQVPYTVTRQIPGADVQEAYTVDKLVERTEYDTHRYQIPQVKTSTVYDTFNFQTSEQVPTTTEQTYDYQVEKRLPIYRRRRVPVYSEEEIEHSTSRVVPHTKLVKSIETHSHTLDQENEHAH